MVLSECLYLTSFLDQHLAHLADGFGGVQAFGANLHAIHDTAATENAEGIVEVFEALGGGSIAAIGEKAVRLQQAGRTNKFIGVPPKRWARG